MFHYAVVPQAASRVLPVRLSARLSLRTGSRLNNKKGIEKQAELA